LILKAYSGKDSTTETITSDANELKTFINAIIFQLLTSKNLTKYENTLLNLCLYNRLRTTPELIPVCIDMIQTCSSSAHVETKETGHVCHPLLVSDSLSSSALNSVLQQIILCRKFTQNVAVSDPSKSSKEEEQLVYALKEFFVKCTKCFADGTVIESKSVENALAKFKSFSSPSDIWKIFKNLAPRTIDSKIRSWSKGVLVLNTIPAIVCKKGSDLNSILLASKPQLFEDCSKGSSVSSYPSQFMVDLSEKYHSLSSELVPSVKISSSITLGNHVKYTLTGFILKTKGSSERFISCVRTFYSSKSKSFEKGWVLCGADDTHVIHVSQSFVDQYLNGENIWLWKKTPIKYVVYTALSPEDEAALLKVEEASVATTKFVGTIDERNREMLLLPLLEDDSTLDMLVSSNSPLCSFILKKYTEALIDQSDFVERWSALANAILSKSSIISDTFLKEQIRYDARGPEESKMGHMFLHCTSEKMRIFYEESMITAMRRVEPDEDAVLSQVGFILVPCVEILEEQFTSSTVIHVLFTALRLLDPVRPNWMRFKQYFKFLLDISQLSPTIERILLAINIGAEIYGWFLNKPTALSKNAEFLSRDGYPDLDELIQLINLLFKSATVKSHLDTPSVNEFIRFIFSESFFSSLAVYPYNTPARKSLAEEYCRDNFKRTQDMWHILSGKLLKSISAKRIAELKNFIIFFCGIQDSIVDKRLSMVLGINGAPMSRSIFAPWMIKDCDDAAYLSSAEIFSGLCNVPGVRNAILLNVRKFLWLEFAARNKVVQKYGERFQTTYSIKEDDFAVRDSAPALVNAYIVMHATCVSLERSLLPPIPKEEEANPEMGSMMTHLHMVYTRGGDAGTYDHVDDVGTMSDISTDVDSSSVEVAQKRGRDKEEDAATQLSQMGRGSKTTKTVTTPSVNEDDVMMVKSIVGESFTDDQIRRALHDKINVEHAIDALFNGFY